MSALADPVAVGIVTALIVGKAFGVFGATFLITKTTRAQLDDGLKWVDVAGLSLLAGVGFTVSLLIAELSFGSGSAHDDHAKVAILAGSLTAAALAAVVLKARNRHYRRAGSGGGKGRRRRRRPGCLRTVRTGPLNGAGPPARSGQAAWFRASSAATQEIMAHFTLAA